MLLTACTVSLIALFYRSHRDTEGDERRHEISFIFAPRISVSLWLLFRPFFYAPALAVASARWAAGDLATAAARLRAKR